MRLPRIPLRTEIARLLPLAVRADGIDPNELKRRMRPHSVLIFDSEPRELEGSAKLLAKHRSAGRDATSIDCRLQGTTL